MDDFLGKELEKLDKVIGENIKKISIGKVNDTQTIAAYEICNCKNAPYIVIAGMPHGNEPIGFWYCVYFIRTFEKRKNENYLVIPVLDYEIAVRNTWIGSSFNIEKFASQNFINCIDEQIEFSYGRKMKEYQQGLIKKIKEYKVKYCIFIHQIPTISGGHCYTNMVNDYGMIDGITAAFRANGIPMDEFPQGDGVIKYARGIFGIFRTENIGLKKNQYNIGYSCQEYFNDILKQNFIAVEIPFWIATMRSNERDIYFNDLKNDIIEIVIKSKELLKYIKLLNRDEVVRACIYWLENSRNMDVAVLDIINSFGNFCSRGDLYYILKHLIYKLNYVAMATRIPEKKIRLKSIELSKKILSVFNMYKSIIGIKYIENTIGFAIIDDIIDAFENIYT